MGRNVPEDRDDDSTTSGPDPAVSACDIVLYGATGDLAQRKLYRALYYLYQEGFLDDDSRVVGVARRELDRETFVARVLESLGETVPQADRYAGNLARFSRLLDYRPVARLYDELPSVFDDDRRTRVFYLSTNYAVFGDACRSLRDAGLITPRSRLVLEKPIGESGKTARGVNEAVAECFAEDQVFRIDHYLGKETVQNLIALRFGNVLFEPLWNRSWIEEVQITVAEDMDVEERLGFYDKAGALRDMVQSHLLQLLCLVAMEVPRSLEPAAVREEKLKVLHALEPIVDEAVDDLTVRGQYQGYGKASGLDSQTETFVALRASVANWRWNGVPFYLRTGKCMAKKAAQIVVKFRGVPKDLFGGGLDSNRLVLQLQPDDGVRLEMVAKQPGHGMHMQNVWLSLDFHATSDLRRPHSYERLIRDALLGDPTLFLHRDEIDLAWRFVDPIIERWATGETPLHEYARGSHGPEVANRLVISDGSWDDELLDSGS